MLEAKEMKQGRVEVIDVYGFVNRLPTKVVCSSYDLPTTNASSSEAGCKCLRVVVTTVGALR